MFLKCKHIFQLRKFARIILELVRCVRLLAESNFKNLSYFSNFRMPSSFLTLSLVSNLLALIDRQVVKAKTAYNEVINFGGDADSHCTSWNYLLNTESQLEI